MRIISALIFIVILLLANSCRQCKEESEKVSKILPHLDPELFIPDPTHSLPLRRISNIAVGFNDAESFFAAGRTLEGELLYFFPGNNILETEIVSSDILPGIISITELSTGEIMVAAISRPSIILPPVDHTTGKKASGAVSEPDLQKPSAISELLPDRGGDLMLFTRRSPDIWRKRKISSHAIMPALASGSDRTIHIAYLLTEAEGLYFLVYVRISNGSMQREIVARNVHPTPPHILIYGPDEFPVLTFTADIPEIGGPVIMQTIGNERGAFERPMIFPGLSGSPPVVPKSLAWDGDYRSGSLYMLLPVSKLTLTDNPALSLHKEAEQILFEAIIKNGEIQKAGPLVSGGKLNASAQMLFSTYGKNMMNMALWSGANAILGDMEQNSFVYRKSRPEDLQLTPPELWIIDTALID